MLVQIIAGVVLCLLYRLTAVGASLWLSEGFGNRLLAGDRIAHLQSAMFPVAFDGAADLDDDVELMTTQLLNQLGPSGIDDDETLSRSHEAASHVRSLQWHGTTTLAFKHHDAIIVCVDSKASTGEYIASKTVKKVIPITESIVATMAGGAADCYHNIRRVGTLMKIEEATMGLDITVKAVAKLLQNIILSGEKLQLGCMVAGIDAIFGPQLYYIDSSGDFVEGDRFCVGSGSTLAYSALDSALKPTTEPSKPISLTQAVYHAMWAVRHATVRDAFSGGYINAFVIRRSKQHPHGKVHHVARVDCKELEVPLTAHSLVVDSDSEDGGGDGNGTNTTSSEPTSTTVPVKVMQVMDSIQHELDT